MARTPDRTRLQDFVVTSGDEVTGEDLATGTPLTMRGGNSTTASNDGADVLVTGGTNTNGTPGDTTGGDLLLTAGAGTGSGDQGTVTIGGVVVEVSDRLEVGGNGFIGAGLTPALFVSGNSGVIRATSSVTDAQNKFIRIEVPHFTNAEQSLAVIRGAAESADNFVTIGGGEPGSVENAATQVSIYTAADTTTTTGTERMRVDSAGDVLFLATTNRFVTIASTSLAQFTADGGAAADKIYAWRQAGNNTWYTKSEATTHDWTLNRRNPAGGGNVDDPITVRSATGVVEILQRLEAMDRLEVGGAAFLGPAAPAVWASGNNGTFRAASVVTDATLKTGRLEVAHNTNAEEPLAVVLGVSSGASGVVHIGGGSAIANAATALFFYTAANNTTTTGTAVLECNSAGDVLLLSGATLFLDATTGRVTNTADASQAAALLDLDSGATGGGAALVGGAGLSGNTPGSPVSVTAGAGFGTDQAGGPINITAGNATGTGAAGDVNITAGEDGGSSATGSIVLTVGVAGFAVTTYEPAFGRWDMGGPMIGPGSAALFITGNNGSIRATSTQLNSVNKFVRLETAHFTNAEEPLAVVTGVSQTAANEVRIGGGESFQNAATQISLFTAANNTTTTGTEVLRVNSAQNVLLIGSATLGESGTRIADYFGVDADFSGDVDITGKLTVTGGIDPSYLGLNEQGSKPFTAASTIGFFWVDSTTTPHRFVFTNESDEDLFLSAADGLVFSGAAKLRGADGSSAAGSDASVTGGTGDTGFDGGKVVLTGGVPGSGGARGIIELAANTVEPQPAATVPFEIVLPTVGTGDGNDFRIAASTTTDTATGGSLILEPGTGATADGEVALMNNSVFKTSTGDEAGRIIPTSLDIKIEGKNAAAASGLAGNSVTIEAGDGDGVGDAGDVFISPGVEGASGGPGSMHIALHPGTATGSQVRLRDGATTRSFFDVATASTTTFAGSPSTGAAVLGESININGGDQSSTTATADAGSVTITSGTVGDAGSSSDAGNINLVPGTNAGSGTQGFVSVSGDLTMVSGGQITADSIITADSATAEPADLAYTGGSYTGADATDRDGATINFTAGSTDATVAGARGGDIFIRSGDSTGGGGTVGGIEILAPNATAASEPAGGIRLVGEPTATYASSVIAIDSASQISLSGGDGLSGATAGRTLSLSGGRGFGTGNGGSTSIDAGDGSGTAGSDGGAASLNAGDATGANNGDGGALTLRSGAGAGAGGIGGLIALTVGAAGTTSAPGGSVTLTAGDGGSTSGDAGTVDLVGGTATSGTDGAVQVFTNGAVDALEMRTLEVQTTTTGNNDFTIAVLDANGEHASVEIHATGQESSGAANFYSRKIITSWYRTAGAPAEIATRHLDSTQTVGTVTGWSTDVINSSDNILVRITGAASTTINWSVSIQVKVRD